MTKISKHIGYNEATKSATAVRHGVDNVPNAFELENMKLVANECFEPLREHHGAPIGITSFFRSSLVNSLIGGSGSSQHCSGGSSNKEESAIDIDADIYNNGISNCYIFNWLCKNVEFDQLIWEFGNDSEPSWVHVSYRKGGNRSQVLKAIKVNGKTKYLKYESN